MAKVALVIALIALLVAVLAYRETGGTRALEESVRALQGALDVARKETADALARLERAVRSPETPESPAAKPGTKPKP
jgi:hypothetical protein